MVEAAVLIKNRIINIRGTSGSGKSTLVKRLLAEYENIPIEGRLGDWKKPKVIGYVIYPPPLIQSWVSLPTFILGSYKTQCGGCDSMSYKGAHDDMEMLIREAAHKGYNVIFEGLTVSSTVTRWQRVAKDFPNQFCWAFMVTPEEECHQRILARNGGKEPKHHGPRQLADYQVKFRACQTQMYNLDDDGEYILPLLSDDQSYELLKHQLGYY